MTFPPSASGGEPEAKALRVVLNLADVLDIKVHRVRRIEKRFLTNHNRYFHENPLTSLSGLIRFPSRTRHVVLVDRVTLLGETWEDIEQASVPQWIQALHEIAHAYLDNLSADEIRDGMYSWEIGAFEAAIGRKSSFLRHFYWIVAGKECPYPDDIADYHANRWANGTHWGRTVRQRKMETP